VARFVYRARDSGGGLKTGSLDAASRDNLAGELMRQGLTPVSIEPAGAENSLSLDLQDRWSKWKKISLDELIIFSRQMHALSKAGVPIIKALTGLQDASRSPAMAKVLGEVVKRLEGGVALASAMRPHPQAFDELYVAMVMVGENTGRLDEVFMQLAANLELERETRKRVGQALRYPLIVVMAITVAILVINYFVIPAFASVFAKFGADLPLPTKILVASSNFLLNYGWWVGAGLVATVYAFFYWKKTAAGNLQWDRFKLRIPIVGPLLNLVALSRFARNFALMIKGGLPITQALGLVSDSLDNRYLGKAIGDMRTGIERGDTLLRTASAAGLFSPLIIQMLAVGEETGSIDQLLTNVADFYDEEVAYALKRLADSIEPILLVFMGIMVLILALGVFLPIWDLGSVALGKG
jgi:MSHA biogenesis protein MshG